jgi:hypothetical protein
MVILCDLPFHEQLLFTDGCWSELVFCSQELFITAGCFIGTDLHVLHSFMFANTIRSLLASEVLKFGPMVQESLMKWMHFSLYCYIWSPLVKEIWRLYFITHSGNCQVSKYVTYFCAKFQVVRIIVVLEVFIVLGKYHATFNRMWRCHMM